MAIKTNRSVRLNGINPLAYIGQNSYTPPDLQIYQRDPTINDWQDFYVGDLWINQVYLTNTYKIWMLVGKQNNQAKWVLIGNGAGTGDLISLTGDTGTNPVFGDANNNINIVGGIGIDTVGNSGTNSITINITGDIAQLYFASSGVSTPTATGGSAIPLSNILNVQSAHNISVSAGLPNTGAANDVVYWMNNAITLGDLSAIAANSNALTCTTGDIRITAGNLKIPLATSNTQGVIFFDTAPTLFSFGTNNNFFGTNSGNFTLTASTDCLGLGPNTLNGLTTGVSNIAIGFTALGQCTSGSDNISIGVGTLFESLTTNECIALGNEALNELVSGSEVIGIGAQAGISYTGAESNNIVIGNAGTTGESNTIRIGTSGAGAGQQNKTFIAGIRGITTAVNDAVAVLIDSAGQLGTVSSSLRYKENIKPMAESSSSIMYLRPVVFNYKKHKEDQLSYGLIAEDVVKTMPELVVFDEENRPETVKYLDLIPMLLNEVQKMDKRIKQLETCCRSC